MLTLALVTGGKENILPRLALNPAWQHSSFKTQSVAADILVAEAKAVALQEADTLLRTDLTADVRDYITRNGERPNTQDEGNEWDSGLDDVISARLEPYEKYLSANWLGINTVDTRAHRAPELDRLIKSFANEIWSQLTYNRSANQILSGVGIVSTDLDAIAHTASQPFAPFLQLPPATEHDPMSINRVLNKIILSFPDEASLSDDLDMASDTDDGLAIGAANRLGIDMADVAVLRAAREASGAALDAWENAITAGELLDENKVYVDLSPVAVDANGEPEMPASLVRNPDPATGLPTMPPPPPAKAAGAPPPPPPPVAAGTAPPPPPPPPSVTTGAPPPPTKKGRGGKRSATPAEPPAGAIPAATLMAIKTAAGLKDDELAAMLGVARSSVNNMVNGKTPCVPSPDALARLKTMLYERISAMTAAYQTI